MRGRHGRRHGRRRRASLQGRPARGRDDPALPRGVQCLQAEAGKPPKVPKSRAPEPAFTELSAEAKSERDVLKMLKNMEAEGMPGMSMYSRDALYGGEVL